MTVTAAVEGVDRLVATLETAAVEVLDLDLDPAAADLAAAARPRTPYRTGALESTVRASVVDQTVTLEAGGPAVAYAGIVHARTPWLADTITAQTDQLVDLVLDAVDDTLSHIEGA